MHMIPGKDADPIWARRFWIQYRAVVREHFPRNNPEIPIPLQTVKALRAQGLSDREVYDRVRPSRLLPLTPSDRERFLREADSRARTDVHLARQIADTIRMMALYRDHPEMARRSGVDLQNAPGMLIRHWFGGEKVKLPVRGVDGQLEWRESRRHHAEHTEATKAFLFEVFVQYLWSTWFQLRRPRLEGEPPRQDGSELTDLETRAYSELRKLLVRSYRKIYAGGRGRKRFLRNEPEKLWTLPPGEVVPYLVGAAIERAKYSEAPRRSSKSLPDPIPQSRAKRTKPDSPGPSRVIGLFDRYLDKPQPVKRLHGDQEKTR